MSVGIYYGIVHVPDSSVADKIGVIVKEARRAVDFTDFHVVPFYYVDGLGAHEAYKTVRIRLLLGEHRKYC